MADRYMGSATKWVEVTKADADLPGGVARGLLVGTAGTALLDNDPSTMPDWTSLMQAVAGLGLMAARDNKVSSEDVGAK